MASLELVGKKRQERGSGAIGRKSNTVDKDRWQVLLGTLNSRIPWATSKNDREMLAG